MSLLGAHQPVMSYPYYGSWLIAFIGEATLFGFKLDNSRPCGAFEFSQTVVQVGRILLTGLLPTILFLKSTKRGHADEESAPLLGHDKENSKDTQQSKASSSYGSSTAFDDADLEFEESERMKDAKQKEQIEKRLQAHGNWIAYVPLHNDRFA